jgi:NTE family protein
MSAHTDFSFDSDQVWEVSWQFEGEEFEKLRALAEEQQYRARANVFQQGDASDGMYLVLDGYALVIAIDEATRAERTVGIITPGQSFGELGLLVDQPRIATVSAGTNLHVLKITPESLAALEEREPGIASQMYKRLARTLATQLISQGNLLREESK